MTVTIKIGDARVKLRELPDESVNAIVTSPPYYNLRSYLSDDHPDKAHEIGLEETPDEFIAALVAVFREARRVLRNDGTLWLNLGDSYANDGKWGGSSSGKHVEALHGDTGIGRAKRSTGLKQKDLIGIPWRTALALQADGWYLRDAIVWAKPNCMPGSQEDRCTSSYEMVFQLSKSESYWSDFDAIKTPPRESTLIRTAQDVQAQAGSHRANGGGKTNGTMKAVGGLTGAPHGRHALGDAIPPRDRRRDKQRGHSRRHEGFNDRWDQMDRAEQQGRPAMMRNVWFVPPANFADAHYAVMPEEVARRCILAGCPPRGLVLDPFGGAGTTALVADRLGRDAVIVELNPQNAEIARRRIHGDAPLFTEVSAA